MDISFALPSILTNPRSDQGQKTRKVLRKCAREVGRAKLRPQSVVFDIDDAFNARSSNQVNAKALGALLDCLVELNLIYLDLFPNTPGLYETGVFYYLMPTKAPWDTIPTLYGRGYGDCKSLAAARVAELRRQGKAARPVFRHITDQWGTMFHILILHGDGRWECPSRRLGMRTGQEKPVATPIL